jgi:hypothetical protein
VWWSVNILFGGFCYVVLALAKQLTYSYHMYRRPTSNWESNLIVYTETDIGVLLWRPTTNASTLGVVLCKVGKSDIWIYEYVVIELDSSSPP